MQATINVACWLERSRVNGPGERFVLWLQGCPLRCPGCWNQEMWSFAPRTLLTVDELCEQIMDVRGIEGVTLTGGEPFAQAGPLAATAARVRAAGLSVMVFTGYELEELHDEAARALLSLTDIAVAGRFRTEERDLTLRWRGSRNQHAYFLSTRYSETLLSVEEAAIEFHWRADGSVALTGFPTDELVRIGGIQPPSHCV